MRHTKVVATLGPASREPQVLDALIAAGVDIFRFNFSHGTQGEHAALFRLVREACARADRHVAILQDLSGPKIRTGRLLESRPIPLKRGDALTVAIGDGVGAPGRVFTNYAELAVKVSKGDRLLLDDGRLELEVESATSQEIRTRVIDGGELGEYKGINAPRVPLRSDMTEKDKRDLAFGLALGVDMVALSFVQTADDVTRVRAILIHEGRPKVPLIAKLERPEAIERLDEILDASDAVMVARGDLGLEIPLERVPRVQKEILRKARARGVPVIVATQVLESMRTEPRPTRAEASDAAGAVDGGADAIMLSGETATGYYPVRAVEVLDAIIRDAETMPLRVDERRAQGSIVSHQTALCEAAVQLASRSGAHAIVAVTREGNTAKRLSAIRPRADIVAATDNPELARRLNLWHGVIPTVCELTGDAEQVIGRTIEAAVKRTKAAENAIMVVVNTSADLDRGASNFVRIRRA
ncbi:MAG TPA: pyruvate kinase [Vicinamibacterales bacterium]|nr:pyruvate kinase [Vicinamibacterales bacterium]